MATPNKETQKVISEGERLSRLLVSEDWQLAMGKLDAMFTKLDSWSSLPDDMDPKVKLREMEHRQAAISLVRHWISEITGVAAQGKETAKAMRDTQVSEVFSYFPEQKAE